MQTDTTDRPEPNSNLRREVMGGLATELGRSWWMFLLRGIAAIVFSILTFGNPALSLATLVLLFGAYALVDGAFGAVTAIRARHDRDDWGVLLLGGLVGIGVGVLTLFYAPDITAVALLFYVAIWAVAMGVLEVVTAIRLRKFIQGEWLLGLAGIASVVFGVLLMTRPAAGALSLMWAIAAYAAGLGVVLVALSFRVRSFARRFGGGPQHPRPA
jgi:uncharacterized membrane protein HdeD (DUF308 family)